MHHCRNKTQYLNPKIELSISHLGFSVLYWVVFNLVKNILYERSRTIEISHTTIKHTSLCLIYKHYESFYIIKTYIYLFKNIYSMIIYVLYRHTYILIINMHTHLFNDVHVCVCDMCDSIAHFVKHNTYFCLLNEDIRETEKETIWCLLSCDKYDVFSMNYFI